MAYQPILFRYYNNLVFVIWASWITVCLVSLLILIRYGDGWAWSMPVLGLGVCSALNIFLRRRVGLGWMIQRHLGIVHENEGTSLFQEIRTRDRVNYQLALDRLYSEGKSAMSAVVGVPRLFDQISSAVATLITHNFVASTLEWDVLPRALDEKLSCARNALYLLHVNGRPCCIVIQPPTDPYRPVYRLEVFAADAKVAQGALELTQKAMRDLNVYRRAYIAFEPAAYFEDKFDVVFHPIPTVIREQIILPEALLRIIERNTVDFLARQEALRAAGQSTQRGLLFYGPPGTGKTLVTKYVAGVSNCTIIVLSGANTTFIRDACAYARLLAPAIIVMEDVDLVAQDREAILNNSLLHELMESMDGLGPRSDCVFILTTNRPESLEKALASRPGRVDQAIHFPFPEIAERRRLFERFSRDLDISRVNLNSILDRTEGTSPAFIQELVRKAALFALERGENSAPLRLEKDDFDEALKEFTLFGGHLTGRILGFNVPTNSGVTFG